MTSTTGHQPHRSQPQQRQRRRFRRRDDQQIRIALRRRHALHAERQRQVTRQLRIRQTRRQDDAEVRPVRVGAAVDQGI